MESSRERGRVPTIWIRMKRSGQIVPHERLVPPCCSSVYRDNVLKDSWRERSETAFREGKKDLHLGSFLPHQTPIPATLPGMPLPLHAPSQ